MATVRTNLYGTYDDDLELRTASKVTVDGAGSATIDIGTGYVTGNFCVNVTAMEVIRPSGVKYDIKLQGSNVTGGTFTSGDIVDLAVLRLGDAAALAGTSDKTTGLYKVPFCNQLGNKTWRYLRTYHDITGSCTGLPATTSGSGLNYTAWLTK